MPPKKRRYDLDLPKEAPSASGSTAHAPSGTIRGAGILTEITRIRTDGSVVHESRMAAVPASTHTKENEPLWLLPDQPGQASAPHDAPLYDLYEQQEQFDDGAAFLDDAPREMRESDYPLAGWVKDERDNALREMLRAEGRGDHHDYTICQHCKTPEATATYRCEECLRGGEILCRACMVSTHAPNPLHRIEMWAGEFFEPTTLKSLALRIQLGHWQPGDRRCAAPDAAAGEVFVIVDNHAVHEVFLDFCGCGLGGSKVRQLMRAGLYPATGTNPRTAASFSVMRRFHLVSLESKISIYEFYHSLARGTNNTGVEPLAKDRYHEFLRMTREWRHLQLLKRSGRGHDPTGAMGTGPGECALLCPACPHPGKNLPEDWKNGAEGKQWVFFEQQWMPPDRALLQEADPGLHSGWAFFCEVSAYMAHLADHWDKPQDRSTCVAHDAVDKPDREARGTASSGIGAVDCARHNMKRPNAVGDLQFGERYINMDYMFFRSIAGTDLVEFFVSYDIACQWHKNIWGRMEDYDVKLKYLPTGKFMTFLVPKFHLPAHIEACNLQYSFNLTRNVGQTDGKALERGWANANPLASSTKEMGPGARRDALDDHFNDWNYKKVIAFENGGRGTADGREEGGAGRDGVIAGAGGSGFGGGPGGGVDEDGRGLGKEPEKPNPFETVNKNDHLAQVLHDLAVEAAEREAKGKGVEGAVMEDMHITEMIAMGLQLEEQQRTLAHDSVAVGLHPTVNQRRAMVERTSKLRRKILGWIDIQNGFFPSVKVLRAKEDEARARIARTQPIPGLHVYEIKLWLPSAMAKRPGSMSTMTALQKEAVGYEYRLRIGEATEALDEIRAQLLVRSRLYKGKDANARGVRENMRSQAALDNLNNRVRQRANGLGEDATAVAGGRCARDASGDLWRSGAAAWGQGKGEAEEEEVKARRGAGGDVVDLGGPGRSREPSGTLRIEWAKARARAMRWTEEVDLLEEEMRRIQQFLTWRAGWWLERADGHQREDGPQREGDFAAKWAHLPELVRKGRVGELDPVAGGTAGAMHDDDSDGSSSKSGDGSDDGARPVPRSSKVLVDPLYLD
ncbi:hypothetical protein C8F04DRAFT_1272805 [Mycena alexandri]|uniref:CxC2-like cysteine cluster KDZ transposase-associated domain-containing protein n=1 Tax=Mycena alexandri TaxID=1745969 RepID=A0AAD6SB40_9AGAR|nr:hypothetical protein C8F04DRAFT_1272805 [Mycena alexandri]